MNSPIRRIGLLLKRHDRRIPTIILELIPWLQSRGIEFVLDREDARQYSVSAPVREPGLLASGVDLVAVFGGDGTLLYAARLVAATGVPILGVNLGSLGFLTEVPVDEMFTAFEALISGNYDIEQRMLLDVEVTRKQQVTARYLALNDAVINKGALARIIDIEVSVNSQLVTTVRADGLIVSTPTGSTGYSLSAGGPILVPSLEALIITPICPHTLTNRAVVVASNAVVGSCLRHGTDVMLTVDGQVGMRLEDEECIRVRKADASLQLVKPFGKDTFFKLLREKLKWG